MFQVTCLRLSIICYESRYLRVLIVYAGDLTRISLEFRGKLQAWTCTVIVGTMCRTAWGDAAFQVSPLCCITAVLESVSPVAIISAVRTCIGSLCVPALDSLWIRWRQTRSQIAHLDVKELLCRWEPQNEFCRSKISELCSEYGWYCSNRPRKLMILNRRIPKCLLFWFVFH